MTYRSTVLADSPTHFWDLQDASGSTAATDYGGGTQVALTKNGTVTFGGTGPQGAAVDKALTLASSNPNLSAASQTDLNITGDLTLEMWIKPLNFSNYWFLVTKTTGGGGTASPYEWRIDTSTGKPWFGHAGASNPSLLATTALTVGVWNHIAVTRNGSTVTHYLNGATNGSSTFGVAATTNANPLQVGTRTDNFSYANWTGAYIAMWNSALTTAQIAAHYAAYVPAPSVLQLSQVALEVIASGTPHLQLSQVAQEVIASGTPHLQLSQVAIEVIQSRTVLEAFGYKLTPCIC